MPRFKSSRVALPPRPGNISHGGDPGPQTSYPDDRATGFEVGDLCGAFPIEYRTE